MPVDFDLNRFLAAYRMVQQCDRENQPACLSDPTLHVFDCLASTNQTAWEYCQSGASHGTGILALAQTAGRGQWGQQWQSSTGGLYLSVILRPQLAIAQSAQLTLCTAWGIARCLRVIPARLSGVPAGLPVQLKWLNDLILRGRKLGGILTETRLRQGQITTAVVGVGINWQNPVPELGINLQSYLSSPSVPLSVPLIESLELLSAIALYGIQLGYQRLQEAGIDSLLPEYWAWLTHRDRSVSINGQTGQIIGVTAAGELRLWLDHPPRYPNQPILAPTPSEILIKPGTISLGYLPET